MDIDLKEVPFEQVEKLGINRQMLEQTGNLGKLLKGEKSDLITNFKIKQAGVEKTFSAHLLLERDHLGRLQFRIRAPEIKEVIQLATEKDISLDKIPFKQIAPFGVSRSSLEASGNLEKLLKGEKTSIINNLTFQISGQEKKASGRLFLIVTPNGSLKFQIDFVKASQLMQFSGEEQSKG